MKKFHLLLLLVIGMPLSSFAQQSPNSNACNQPMPEPVSYFKLSLNPNVAVATHDGCWVFVNFQTGQRQDRGIAVLRRNGGTIEQVRFVNVDQAGIGLSLTHDEKTLIVSAQRAVVFLDVERLISGKGDPVLGSISDRHFSATVWSTVTRDDKYLFVAQTNTQWLTIIDLEKARATGFGKEAIVGGLPVAFPGPPVVSPDGRYLYLTADGTPETFGRPDKCTDPREPTAAPGYEGGLLVIDMETLKAKPAPTVAFTVTTGCSSRRIAVSPDGNMLYVTATFDNALLIFDARPIQSGSPPVLTSKISVGPFPVGIAVIENGKKIVVSNASLLADEPNGKRNLAVIDTSKVLEGAKAILGLIPSGTDPRVLGVTADGKTLLANTGSPELEIVDLERLILLPAPGR